MNSKMQIPNKRKQDQSKAKLSSTPRNQVKSNSINNYFTSKASSTIDLQLAIKETSPRSAHEPINRGTSDSRQLSSGQTRITSSAEAEIVKINWLNLFFQFFDFVNKKL